MSGTEEEEEKFAEAVNEYNRICDKIEEIVDFELRDYKRLKLSSLVQKASNDLRRAESYIEDAKYLIRKHHIADDSRLKELIDRL